MQPHFSAIQEKILGISSDSQLSQMELCTLNEGLLLLRYCIFDFIYY